MTDQQVETIPLEAGTLRSTQLAAMSPWPASIRPDGHKHGATEVFAGEFTAYVYETEAGVMNFKDYPFDEFVTVLSGVAILTPKGGEPSEYPAGASFIVPKGFTGTWEVREGYRELFIIETESMAKGFQVLGLA